MESSQAASSASGRKPLVAFLGPVSSYSHQVGRLVLHFDTRREHNGIGNLLPRPEAIK